MKKKGAVPEGLNVSILVILIALFIIGYIVLLPPEEREELLGTEEIEEGEVKTLLSESPGFVSPFEEETVSHKLSPFDLFVRVEPVVSSVLGSLFLEAGLFTRRSHELTFDLDQLDSLKRVDLYFFVRNSKGTLHVKLNGEKVYADKIVAGKIMSIKLPPRLLEDTNNIELFLSPALFGRNRYFLEDIKIREEYQSSNTEEERYFVISSYEYNYLRNAKLNYFMHCRAFSEKGTELEIELNNKPFRDINIPCVNRDVSFDINLVDLKEGKNSLSFEIDRGDYSFRDVEIEVELKEKTYPTFYFVVDEDDYESVVDEDLVAVLDLTFTDIDRLKEAQIFVNNKRIYLSSRNDAYSKDISDYLKEGSNKLKIVPKNRFEIINLEVDLEEA